MGPALINDPSGLTFDAQLARVAAKHDAGLIITHMRGTPETWAKLAPLKDVLGTILKDLDASLRIAPCVRAWIARGLRSIRGSASESAKEQNAEILARLSELAALEFPLLVGPSRKSFLPQLEKPSEGFLQCATAAAVTASHFGRRARGSRPRRGRDEGGGAAGRSGSQLRLALWTVVRSALSHHDPADRRSASRGRARRRVRRPDAAAENCRAGRRHRRNWRSTSLSIEWPRRECRPWRDAGARRARCSSWRRWRGG